jgi:hypothetical protein
VPVLDLSHWIASAKIYFSSFAAPGTLRGRTNMEQPAIAAPGRPEESQDACANKCCPRRVKPNTSRALFLEGRPVCSKTCWALLFEEKLQREWTRSFNEASKYAHRVPFGALLVEQGVITAEQCDAAVEAQRVVGSGRIGDWLRQECGVTEQQITRALGMQWNCPVFDLRQHCSVPSGIPVEVLQEYRVLPLRARGRGVLYLAYDNRPNAVLRLAVQHMVGRRVENGLATEASFAEKWDLARSDEQGHRALRLEPGTWEMIQRDVESRPGQADVRIARLERHIWVRVLLTSPNTGPNATAENVVLRDYLIPVTPWIR